MVRQNPHQSSKSNTTPHAGQQERSKESVAELLATGLPPALISALPASVRSLYEVQKRVIPDVLRGENIVGLARTGEGKTFAYALPLIARLLQMPTPLPKGVAHIVVPSSQLAEQVHREIAPIAGALGIKTNFFLEERNGKGYPGSRNESSRESVHNIAIGTPRALLQAGYTRQFFLADASIVVFDEADYLLGKEMFPETEQFAAELKSFEERQTLLFSATLPIEVIGRISDIIPGGKVINTGIERPLDRIKHFIAPIFDSNRFDAALEIFTSQRISKGIFFCGEKEDCPELVFQLAKNRIKAAAIYETLDPLDRIRSVAALSEGRIQALVATPDMARGLDIFGLTHVINISVPQDVSEYTQLAGRTGRRGEAGTCVTLVPPEVRYEFETMMAVLKLKVDCLSLKASAPTLSTRRHRDEIAPQNIIDGLQKRIGYTFVNPGLILTSVNRNSRSCVPREIPPLVNLVGRKACNVARMTLKTLTDASSTPLPSGIELDRRGFSRREISKLIDYLGVSSLVPEDKRPGVGFTERVSNTEQAVYNMCGALLIDSGSLQETSSLLIEALGIREATEVGLKRIQARTLARSPEELDRLEQYQHALEYRFKSLSILNQAVGKSPSVSLGRSSNDSSSLFKELGSALLDLYVSNALRASYLGPQVGFVGGLSVSGVSERHAPSQIRNEAESILALDTVWSSSEFSPLDRAIIFATGRSVVDNPAAGKVVLQKLLGALYLDGGYDAAKSALDKLFPRLKDRAERATESLMTAFHPERLQECLTEAGDVRARRLDAQRRAIEGQKRALESKTTSKGRETNHETPQATAPSVDYEALLKDEVSTKGLGKLKVSTTRQENGNGFTTRVLLAKKEVASSSSSNRSESIQTACKFALGEIINHG